MLSAVYGIYLTQYGPDSPELAIVLNNLGVVLTQMEEVPRAKDMLEKALEIRCQCYGASHELTENVEQNLEYATNKMNSLEKYRARPGQEENKSSSVGLDSFESSSIYPFCK